MRIAVFVVALAALGAGCRGKGPELDQAGKPIVRDARTGERIYDADAKGEWNNPHGIAPADPTSSVVLVPGAPVWKASEDLTPKDRERAGAAGGRAVTTRFGLQ